MAKKKELEKAMMGKIVKPIVRAMVTTGKIAGKATVRSGKAYNKAIKNAPTIKGPVSFVKANKEGIKAAGKGFTRSVKSETEKIKASKISATEPTKKSVSDWAKSGTKPSTSEKKVVDSKPKKKLTTKQKIGIGVASAAAGAGVIKHANRKRRTLND